MSQIRHEESEIKDDEAHSEECVSINDVRRGDDSSCGIGDNCQKRIPTDEDITTRAQAGIVAALPTTYESLEMYLGIPVTHQCNEDTSIQKQRLCIRDNIKYCWPLLNVWACRRKIKRQSRLWKDMRGRLSSQKNSKDNLRGSSREMGAA